MVRALPVARVHHAQNDFLRERGEGLLLLSPMPPLWRPIPTMGRSHRNATASSSHRFMRSARRERALDSSLVTRTNVATPTRNREEAISIPRGTQNPRLSRLHHPRLSCSLIALFKDHTGSRTMPEQRKLYSTPLRQHLCCKALARILRPKAYNLHPQMIRPGHQ